MVDKHGTFNEDIETMALQAETRKQFSIREKITQEFDAVKASKSFNKNLNRRLEDVQKKSMANQSDRRYE